MNKVFQGSVLAAWLLAAGCVTPTTLQPIPAAPTTQAGAPVTEGEGIRLVARGDAWRGNPSDLDRIVTPVQVTLENHGQRPLRIDYADFVLVGSSNFEYAALSPFQLREESRNAVGGSGFQGSVAPSADLVIRPVRWGPGHLHAHGWGVGGGGWYGPAWGWYNPFSGPYGYSPEPPPLPTRDMVRTALPQGTLPPGGSLTGFLYFHNVSEREGRVTLQARLVDAGTGETFGTLSIPFDVRS